MRIYNTLSRTIEDFQPIDDPVEMYTCGLTVYSQPQIGNWVAYIYSDVLTRVLLSSGYSVYRVQNITDVGHLTSDEDTGEDKLVKGARKEGMSAWDIANKYIAIADDEAYTTLGLLRPDKLVRATNLIKEQIDFIKELEKRGVTYVLENDGVYFNSTSFKDYGKLARLDIEGLKPGARVPSDGKKNATDFALWKFSHPGQKRDMEWDSPWGKGFPGWHLECSVIARQTLGDQLDIHTGGIDHIPVHHTNEIAQTETITHKPLSKYWFHNNHLKINGTKLSKSLGNSFTLSDIIEKGFDVNAFKLLVLSSHYRTEGNFSWEIMSAFQNRLNKWLYASDLTWQLESSSKELNILSILQNDLDTPAALAAIDDYFNAVSSEGSAPSKESIKHIEEILGVNLARKDITEEQKYLLSRRQRAREQQDWSESDRIRDQLNSRGVVVLDQQNRQLWHYK